MPDSSDKLFDKPDEPVILAAIPIDPYDGMSIRLASTHEGIAVYSVGENDIDDGGEVVPEAGARFGDDFGIRLLRPELRGLIVLDSQGAEE